MSKYTLVIYKNPTQRNHSVTTHKTLESARNRIKCLLADGLAGCSFAINKTPVSAVDIGLPIDSTEYRSNLFA